MSTREADITRSPVGLRSSETPGRRQGWAGVAMVLVGSASAQTGAAIGALAFPVIGAVGVVALRQLVTGLILGVAVRPNVRLLRRGQWAMVIALGLVFGVMNICLYAAIDRIGLALAVTLEFLGPLAVAVFTSRRWVDYVCAFVAAGGVFILADPGPSSDVVGIFLALGAAASWAAYILLNRRVGATLPGLHGTSLASMVAAAVWTPIAVVWFLTHPPTPAALIAGAACAVLASLVPYAADLLALRRVRANVFATLTSSYPVWAAVAGWLILGQALHLREAIGILIIVGSGVMVTVTQHSRT